MSRGSAWAGRHDREFALAEEPQQRRLPEWEDKRARRRAEFGARIAAIAAQVASEVSAEVASEVSAAVAAALQAVRAGHHQYLDLPSMTTSTPAASVADHNTFVPDAPVVVSAQRSTSASVQQQQEDAAPRQATENTVANVLAAWTPTTCSTRCPSSTVTMSVSAAAPAATSTSSKVIVGVIPELCCLDLEPSDVLEQVTTLPATCSTNCSSNDIDTLSPASSSTQGTPARLHPKITQALTPELKVQVSTWPSNLSTNGAHNRKVFVVMEDLFLTTAVPSEASIVQSLECINCVLQKSVHERCLLICFGVHMDMLKPMSRLIVHWNVKKRGQVLRPMPWPSFECIQVRILWCLGKSPNCTKEQAEETGNPHLFKDFVLMNSVFTFCQVKLLFQDDYAQEAQSDCHVIDTGFIHNENDFEPACKTLARCFPSISDFAWVDRVSFPLPKSVVRLENHTEKLHKYFVFLVAPKICPSCELLLLIVIWATAESDADHNLVLLQGKIGEGAVNMQFPGPLHEVHLYWLLPCFPDSCNMLKCVHDAHHDPEYFLWAIAWLLVDSFCARSNSERSGIVTIREPSWNYQCCFGPIQWEIAWFFPSEYFASHRQIAQPLFAHSVQPCTPGEVSLLELEQVQWRTARVTFKELLFPHMGEEILPANSTVVGYCVVDLPGWYMLATGGFKSAAAYFAEFYTAQCINVCFPPGAATTTLQIWQSHIWVNVLLKFDGFQVWSVHHQFCRLCYMLGKCISTLSAGLSVLHGKSLGFISHLVTVLCILDPLGLLFVYEPFTGGFLGHAAVYCYNILVILACAWLEGEPIFFGGSIVSGQVYYPMSVIMLINAHSYDRYLREHH